MRAQEMLAELRGETFGDGGQRNAAGVGGEDGARLAVLQHSLDQGALDFEVLGDGFDDPVAVPYLGEVVLEVAWGDQ